MSLTALLGITTTVAAALLTRNSLAQTSAAVGDTGAIGLPTESLDAIGFSLEAILLTVFLTAFSTLLACFLVWKNNVLQHKVKHKTDKLNEEHAYLSSIIEHTLHGIITIDTQGIIRSYNPGAERIFGYTAEEIIGQNISWLVAPRHRDKHDAYLQRYLQTGQGFLLGKPRELEAEHKDGSKILIELSITQARANGSLFFTSVVRDISSQREQQEIVRTLFEKATDAHLLMGEAGIIDCNQAAVDFLRAPNKAAILNRHPREFSPDVQPDGQSSIAKSDRMDHIARDKGFHRFDWMHRRFDGSLVPIEVTMTPVQLIGQEALLVVWHDITERRRAEDALRKQQQMLRSIIDNTSQLMAVLDTSGTLIDINHSALAVIQQPRDDVLGLSFWDTPWWNHSLESQDQVKAAFEYCLKTGKSSRFEAKHQDYKGNIRLFDFRLNPVLDDQGKVIYLIPESHEITQIREAEHAIIQAKELAEETSRTKSEFLANMSHEIRTPLNGIIGMTELALRTELNNQQRKYLTSIQKSSDILLAVVNDILDFSKLEAGKMILEQAPFQLHSPLEHIQDMFSQSAAQKGLSFALNLDHSLPDTLCGDSLRLTQVLINLCGNAVKFTDQGEVRLDVSVLSHQEGKVVLRFRVTDTGVGMSAEQISRLFTAFTQADASTSRRYGGTGLGLAITKHLVDQMEGTIQVHSSQGKGSCFELSIPFFELDSAGSNFPAAGVSTHATISEIRAAETDALPVHQRGHLLLAEDNPINQEVACGLLESAGYRVTLASNGTQVLDMLKRQAFDLILMDIQMPDLDGYRTSREIRKIPELAWIPIIAMTANAMDSDRTQCLEAGMNDYISKPIDVSRLYSTVAHWLGASKPGTKKNASTQTDVSEPGKGHLDVDEALMRFGNERELYLSVLEKFSESYSTVAQDLKQLIVDQHASDAQRLLHTLKGVAGNLSANVLYELCGELELSLKHGYDWKPVMTQLQDEVSIVIQKIIKLTSSQPSQKSQVGAVRVDAAPSHLAMLKALHERLQNHDYISESDWQFLTDLPLTLIRADQVKELTQCLRNFDYAGSQQRVAEFLFKLSG